MNLKPLELREARPNRPGEGVEVADEITFVARCGVRKNVKVFPFSHAAAGDCDDTTHVLFAGALHKHGLGSFQSREDVRMAED